MSAWVPPPPAGPTVADLVTGYLDGGYQVAVEMPREGIWVSRAEMRGSWLAIWPDHGASEEPAFLIPPTTPYLLRISGPNLTLTETTRTEWP